MAKVTNINDGGVVGIQAGAEDIDHDTNDDRTEVTNINTGGTVGIQGGDVSGCVVVIGGWS